jgi:hypothetical protein
LATRPEFQDIFVDAMTFLGPDTHVGNSQSEENEMVAAGGAD